MFELAWQEFAFDIKSILFKQCKEFCIYNWKQNRMTYIYIY